MAAFLSAQLTRRNSCSANLPGPLRAFLAGGPAASPSSSSLAADPCRVAPLGQGTVSVAIPWRSASGHPTWHTEDNGHVVPEVNTVHLCHVCSLRLGQSVLGHACLVLSPAAAKVPACMHVTLQSCGLLLSGHIVLRRPVCACCSIRELTAACSHLLPCTLDSCHRRRVLSWLFLLNLCSKPFKSRTCPEHACTLQLRTLPTSAFIMRR